MPPDLAALGQDGLKLAGPEVFCVRALGAEVRFVGASFLCFNRVASPAPPWWRDWGLQVHAGDAVVAP